VTWSAPTITPLPAGIVYDCSYPRSDHDNPCGSAPKLHDAKYVDETQDLAPNGNVLATRRRYLCFQAVCAVRCKRSTNA
jgi:hypothetical protein